MHECDRQYTDHTVVTCSFKRSCFQCRCLLLYSYAVCESCLLVQGVLLYGPPGTGKTLLARAVAHHTECTFIRVSGSELVQKFIGEGSRMVRELFVMARLVVILLLYGVHHHHHYTNVT